MIKNSLLLICVLFVCAFSGCSGELSRTTTLFDEILIGSSGIFKVSELPFGASQEDILAAEGLGEDDVQIRDIADINSSFVIVKEKSAYDELDPYGVQKTFTFVDDSLTGIAYSVAYRDVPHEDAYDSAMSVYEKLNIALEDSGAESLESGSIDSLDEVGGTFTKQWVLDGVMISLNMNYQDMSEADFTDMDQFNLSINFTQAK